MPFSAPAFCPEPADDLCRQERASIARATTTRAWSRVLAHALRLFRWRSHPSRLRSRRTISRHPAGWQAGHSRWLGDFALDQRVQSHQRHRRQTLHFNRSE